MTEEEKFTLPLMITGSTVRFFHSTKRYSLSFLVHEKTSGLPQSVWFPRPLFYYNLPNH